jgi:hypothetical protein
MAGRNQKQGRKGQQGLQGPEDMNDGTKSGIFLSLLSL